MKSDEHGPKPTINLRTGGTSNRIELSDAHARKRRTNKEQGGSSEYVMDADTSGYLVVAGNQARFDDMPKTFVTTLSEGDTLTAAVDLGESEFGKGSILYILLYDDVGPVGRHSIPLDVGSVSRTFYIAQAGRATLAIRLRGHCLIERIDLACDARRGGASKAAGGETGAAVPAKAAAVKVERAPWDGLLIQAARHGALYPIAGVLDARSIRSQSEVIHLRADQDFPSVDERPVALYVFDARAAEATYGWSGVFTARNFGANTALIRHLRSAQEKKVERILIYDETTARKLFFQDLIKTFTVRLSSDPPDAYESVASHHRIASEILANA